MQAIIGYVLGVVTVLLLRYAKTPANTEKPQKRAADKHEKQWRETLNFLTYDGNEQEEHENG